jgi:hypothetical protein
MNETLRLQKGTLAIFSCRESKGSAETDGRIARYDECVKRLLNRLALRITNMVGTVDAAIAFSALSLVSLPAAIAAHDPFFIVSWIKPLPNRLSPSICGLKTAPMLLADGYRLPDCRRSSNRHHILAQSFQGSAAGGRSASGWREHRADNGFERWMGGRQRAGVTVGARRARDG